MERIGFLYSIKFIIYPFITADKFLLFKKYKIMALTFLWQKKISLHLLFNYISSTEAKTYHNNTYSRDTNKYLFKNKQHNN